MVIANLHADLSERIVIDTHALEWAPSPQPGVWRRMLERAGAESGRATSIVRYDPRSAFPSHAHPMGEEVFVLDGVFSDEYGDYPAGTYILNPPGSSHAPRSHDGCVLFVKLCQYSGSGRVRVVADTRRMPWDQRAIAGISLRILHTDLERGEYAAMLKWEAGTRDRHHEHPAGEEVLVLAGTLADEHGVYPSGTWIRNPRGSSHAPYSPDGCIILLKTGAF